MTQAYTLQDFAPEYLEHLKINLLPALQRYPGWVVVEQIAEDPAHFVEALVALIRNGYFEDEKGHQRVEIGAGDRRVRYVSDYEIEMIESINHEKSTAISVTQ